VIVNRVHFDGLGGATVAQAHEALAGELGDRLAARVAANLADFDVLVTRDRETVERVTAELDEPSPVLVPHLDEDISDLTGLARLSELLFS
jgi:hypothetical protein